MSLPSGPARDLATATSGTFCSYCGGPPLPEQRIGADRVCLRCDLGVLLNAQSGIPPHPGQPFLIARAVGGQISVQAVSRSTEFALRVDERAAVGRPLTHLLVCDLRAALTLERLVAGAAQGETGDTEVEAVAALDGRLWTVRVDACGPPRAALLKLTGPREGVHTLAVCRLRHTVVSGHAS